MKILIIDDERPALNMLYDTLKRLCDEKDVIVPFKSVREFESYEEKSHFDAAFIDIEIGKVSGIQFALELKNYSPKCNIVFVTSFDKYGTEAFKTRPSGYVLKPYTDEDIKAELDNFRYPVENKHKNKKLKVVTFGNFVVYKDEDELLDFKLTRSKELFAYLIDCCGYPVTTSEISKDLFEKTMDKQTSKNLSKIISGMIEDLQEAGYKDIIIKQNRQLLINKSRVDCDLFDALRGDVESINSYHGEYMIDYSWAELTDSANRLRKIVG